MNILITGGAGFQGKHLVESLIKQNHTVSVLDRHPETPKKKPSSFSDKINIIWGNITDKKTVDEAVQGNDVVFHLAAYINVDESLENPRIFYDVNVLGTLHILEAVKKHRARLIFISSSEVYGDGQFLKEGEKINEHSEIIPRNPYAASKAAADRMCYAFSKSYNINVTIVRPFNIYGEGQKSGVFGALIPILTAKALRGEPLTIFGDGKTTRDYSHISDIIRGYNIILENPDKLSGKVINFASGKNVSVENIAMYIAKKFNVQVKHGPARPGEISGLQADISLAKSIGYTPKINIWEGLDRYIQWVQKQTD